MDSKHRQDGRATKQQRLPVDDDEVGSAGSNPSRFLAPTTGSTSTPWFNSTTTFNHIGPNMFQCRDIPDFAAGPGCQFFQSQSQFQAGLGAATGFQLAGLPHPALGSSGYQEISRGNSYNSFQLDTSRNPEVRPNSSLISFPNLQHYHTVNLLPGADWHGNSHDALQMPAVSAHLHVSNSKF